MRYIRGDIAACGAHVASLSASSYHASDGAAYERFLGRWTRLLAGPLLDFLAPPTDGDLIDVGCGTGSLALAMKERWPGRRVVGVDVARPYIEHARASAGTDAPEFEVAEAGGLPYPDGSFAGAAAQLVLNFVGDPDRAVAEMRRAVRQGDAVAAAVWDFRGGLVYQRLLWDTAAGVDAGAGAARDRLFSHPLTLPDGLVDLFRRGGLVDVARASLTIRMDFASFDDYWTPLLGGQGPFGGFIGALAPDRRLRIEELVRAAYLSGAPDGPRSLTATAWAARGIVP
jgi:SAM-dependent methyltransferase